MAFGPASAAGIDVAAGLPTSLPPSLTVAAAATIRGANVATGPAGARGGMRNILATLAVLCAGAVPMAGGAAAQQPQDPDWPCVQRLVPRLESGQMWSGPPPAAVEQPSVELQETVRGLVDVKTTPEALAASVGDFAAKQPQAERARALGELFWLSLDWLNDERDEMVRGIKRFAVRQKAMADRIVAETRELERLQQASASDAAAAEQLQTARQWDTRIYTDRHKSMTLLCEQPVALEQRAFALARLIQEQLP